MFHVKPSRDRPATFSTGDALRYRLPPTTPACTRRPVDLSSSPFPWGRRSPRTVPGPPHLPDRTPWAFVATEQGHRGHDRDARVQPKRQRRERETVEAGTPSPIDPAARWTSCAQTSGICPSRTSSSLRLRCPSYGQAVSRGTACMLRLRAASPASRVARSSPLRMALPVQALRSGGDATDAAAREQRVAVPCSCDERRADHERSPATRCGAAAPHADIAAVMHRCTWSFRPQSHEARTHEGRAASGYSPRALYTPHSSGSGRGAVVHVGVALLAGVISHAAVTCGAPLRHHRPMVSLHAPADRHTARSWRCERSGATSPGRSAPRSVHDAR